MPEWYYQVMGEQRGPVSSQELKRLADRGDIARDYMVRKADGENWHFAEEVHGLFPATPEQPQPETHEEARPTTLKGLDLSSPPPETHRGLRGLDELLDSPASEEQLFLEGLLGIAAFLAVAFACLALAACVICFTMALNGGLVYVWGGCAALGVFLNSAVLMAVLRIEKHVRP